MFEYGWHVFVLDDLLIEFDDDFFKLFLHQISKMMEYLLIIKNINHSLIIYYKFVLFRLLYSSALLIKIFLRCINILSYYYSNKSLKLKFQKKY